MPVKISLVLLIFSIASSLRVSPHPAGQQHQHRETSETEQLGTVSFPVSCSENAQAGFQRGVALLHSFGYNAAAKQFQEIARQEPACAMAYWGEAMSLYRQLWDRPSEADLQKGRELIRKAQAAGAKIERERGYIEAAAAFYQNGDASYEIRSLAYSEKLNQLRSRYPDDREAAVFYALSLLASPHANDHELAKRKEAVAILLPLFGEEPNHPGIAHYLIHACDNPQMARQGLPAAQRYAQIAPASAHALHMPSHIFARLGLWPEDVQSNVASKTTAEKQSATADRLHAMDFLLYAYLQMGQDRNANATENEALQVGKGDFSKDMEDYFYYVQAHFPALFALETHNWKAAEALAPVPAGPEFQALTYWAQAVGAGHLRDVPAARSAVEKYDKALEAVKKGPYAYVAEQMATNRDEAHGWRLPKETARKQLDYWNRLRINRTKWEKARWRYQPARCSRTCCWNCTNRKKHWRNTVCP